MPTLTQSDALKLVRKFECLGFGFPRTSEGILAMADALIVITGDKERAEWLAGQVIMGCPRCPTPIEMRRIFERKYPAADGQKAKLIDQTDLMSVSLDKDKA